MLNNKTIIYFNENKIFINRNNKITIIEKNIPIKGKYLKNKKKLETFFQGILNNNLFNSVNNKIIILVDKTRLYSENELLKDIFSNLLYKHIIVKRIDLLPRKQNVLNIYVDKYSYTIFSSKFTKLLLYKNMFKSIKKQDILINFLINLIKHNNIVVNEIILYGYNNLNKLSEIIEKKIKIKSYYINDIDCLIIDKIKNTN